MLEQKDIHVVSGDKRVRVTVEYIGEGINGDYDPDDANDTPLLRVGIERRYDKGEEITSGFLGDYNQLQVWNDDPQYLYVRDSSVCTQVSATDPEEIWQALGLYVLSNVESDVRDQRRKKREYELMSYLGLYDIQTWLKSQPK